MLAFSSDFKPGFPFTNVSLLLLFLSAELPGGSVLGSKCLFLAVTSVGWDRSVLLLATGSVFLPDDLVFLCADPAPPPPPDLVLGEATTVDAPDLPGVRLDALGMFGLLLP